MKTPAASGERRAGAGETKNETLADRYSSAARPARQIPTPTDAPPALWQHISGPLARVVADIARLDPEIVHDLGGDRFAPNIFAVSSS